MRTLICYINETGTGQVAWWFATPEASHIDIYYDSLQTLLAEHAEVDKVVILLPGNLINAHHVRLPKTKPSELSKIITYTLEDQLLDDLETLQFSVHADRDGYSVFVFDKALLPPLVKQLQVTNANITILPDYLAIPSFANTWTVVVTEKNCLCRLSTLQGFSLEPDQFISVLQAKLNECTVEGNDQRIPDALKIQTKASLATPLHINIYFASQQEALLKSWPNELITKQGLLPLTYQKLTNSVEMLLTQELIKHSPPLNLADETLKPRTKYAKNWRVTAYLFFAWIILLFTTHIVDYFYLTYEKNKHTQQITEIYKQLFPLDSRTVDPKLLLQHELNTINQQNNDNGLLTLLAKSTPSIKQATQIKVDSLDFQNGRLTFKITAANYRILADLVHQLMQHGLTVNQSNAKAQTNNITADITIHIGENN